MTSPKALILAGDHFHDPQHAFDGIGAAMEKENIEVTCTTNFAALDQGMLQDKALFVLLRDGIEFPNGRGSKPTVWMQPHQEDAIENFVLGGGGFLALHPRQELNNRLANLVQLCAEFLENLSRDTFAFADKA